MKREKKAKAGVTIPAMVRPSLTAALTRLAELRDERSGHAAKSP